MCTLKELKELTERCVHCLLLLPGTLTSGGYFDIWYFSSDLQPGVSAIEGAENCKIERLRDTRKTVNSVTLKFWKENYRLWELFYNKHLNPPYLFLSPDGYENAFGPLYRGPLSGLVHSFWKVSQLFVTWSMKEFIYLWIVSTVFPWQITWGRFSGTKFLLLKQSGQKNCLTVEEYPCVTIALVG